MRLCEEAGSETSANVEQADSKYVMLCDECAYVFAELGEPVSQLLDHAIKLVDEVALPPRL